MPCPQLVYVHRALTVQSSHWRRKTPSHEGPEPALRPVPDGLLTCSSRCCSADGPHVHGDCLLWQFSCLPRDAVRPVVAFDAAMGRYPLCVDLALVVFEWQLRERSPDSGAQWRCLRDGLLQEGSQEGHAVGTDHDGGVLMSGVLEQVFKPGRQGELCSEAGAVSSGRGFSSSASSPSGQSTNTPSSSILGSTSNSDSVKRTGQIHPTMEEVRGTEVVAVLAAADRDAQSRLATP